MGALRLLGETARPPAGVDAGLLTAQLFLQQSGEIRLRRGQGGFHVLQDAKQLPQHLLPLHHGAQLAGGGVQQQTQQGQPLVELGGRGTLADGLGGLAGEDLVHLVVAAVLVEQVVVNRELLGDLGILEILDDELLIHRQVVLLVQVNHLA